MIGYTNIRIGSTVLQVYFADLRVSISNSLLNAFFHGGKESLKINESGFFPGSWAGCQTDPPMLQRAAAAEL